MITVYTAAHAAHNAPHEFLDGALIPCFESPARAEIIHAALVQAGIGPIIAPRGFERRWLDAVHAPDYLQFLETIYPRWVAAGGSPAAVIPSTFAVRWMQQPCNNVLAAPGYYIFDGSAPIMPETYAAAYAAAECALTAATLLLEGQRAAYALCRPPGHHAGHDMGGGYCYLNNAAIAAHMLATQQNGSVAILDIDFHHGNGTQQIFYDREDVLVVSLHGDPAINYPYFAGYATEQGSGPGRGFTMNIPLASGTDNTSYLAALDQACRRIEAYRPSYLIISTGLDTFSGDPVAENGAGFALTTAAYPAIGQRIAALGLPSLFVQEGGYAIDALGTNLVALLSGASST